MKEKIDQWLDHDSNLQGDSLLLTGNIEPKLKLACTNSFTLELVHEKIDFDNIFTPWILIATASCIGAGLDCSAAHSVAHVGFPPSILDLMQEMGRCGRERHGQDGGDKYVLVVNLNDCIYLVERIHTKEQKLEKENKAHAKLCKMIISEQDRIKLEKDNLLKVLQLLVLNKNKFIHYEIECSVSSPMEPEMEVDKNNSCDTACLKCNGSISKVILPLVKKGVQDFLIHTFITSPTSGGIKANDLISKLKTYPHVGKEAYGRKKSKLAPDTKFLQMTMLQLIASELIVIVGSSEEPSATFALGMNSDRTPRCLMGSAWTMFNLIL